MSDLPQRWRDILAHRSVKNKIAFPRHCGLLDPDDLPAITAMVQGGIITFLDTAALPMAAIMKGQRVVTPVSCDIYQLTDEGIALCERNGIAQR